MGKVLHDGVGATMKTTRDNIVSYRAFTLQTWNKIKYTLIK